MFVKCLKYVKKFKPMFSVMFIMNFRLICGLYYRIHSDAFVCFVFKVYCILCSMFLFFTSSDLAAPFSRSIPILATLFEYVANVLDCILTGQSYFFHLRMELMRIDPRLRGLDRPPASSIVFTAILSYKIFILAVYIHGKARTTYLQYEWFSSIGIHLLVLFSNLVHMNRMLIFEMVTFSLEAQKKTLGELLKSSLRRERVERKCEILNRFLKTYKRIIELFNNTMAATKLMVFFLIY